MKMKMQITIMLMTVILMVTGFAAQAQVASGNIALMIQQSPSAGGAVNIGEGVHEYPMGSQVSLTATPSDGYQFVYWLGDVSDSTSPRTYANLDSPKIIIAVYERVEYDFISMEAGSKSMPQGGLTPKGADYYMGGASAPGAKRPSKFHWPKIPDEEENGDFPVPSDGDNTDIPVPEVPEPATMALFGLGALVVSRMRNSRRVRNIKTL